MNRKEAMRLTKDAVEMNNIKALKSMYEIIKGTASTGTTYTYLYLDPNRILKLLEDGYTIEDYDDVYAGPIKVSWE